MDKDAALRFVRALFPVVPDNSAILIWTLQGRRSHWASTHDEAVEVATSAQRDVYIGACLGPRGLPPDKRAQTSQVTVMTSLWADVDFKDPAHQKKNLPANANQALELIDTMPCPPSIVIHSGHGLQAWWLFSEPWILETKADRIAAEELSRGWQALLQKHAHKEKWTVDSTWDLARVMRMAGTTNAKGSKPVDVQVLKHDDGARYHIQDLEDYVPADQLPLPAEKKTPPLLEEPKFKINADAAPPFDKFEAAKHNDDMFDSTWERKRRDLKDGSLSGYDMSMANQCVAIGWTDQEIVDLIIAFRRKHGKPKLRYDYLRSCLMKARRDVQVEAALDRIDELATPPMSTDPEDDPPPEPTNGAPTRAKGGQRRYASDDRRSECLATLSQWLGFKVHQIEMTKADVRMYAMITEHGSFKLGTIKSINSCKLFCERVMDGTGIVVNEKAAKKRWNNMKQVLMDACTEIDIGPEATASGAMGVWLQAYLEEVPPHDLDLGTDDDIQPDWPVVKTIGGMRTLCVAGPHFRFWLRTSPGFGEHLDRQELGAFFNAAGAMLDTIRIAKRTTKRWCLPVPSTYGTTKKKPAADSNVIDFPQSEKANCEGE